jgi:hypothetical protein
MRAVKLTLTLALLSLVCLAQTALANKFEDETAKEKEAVKLVRDTQKGGYGLVSTEELKAWIDASKPMVIVDTMPLPTATRRSMCRARQFPVSHPGHGEVGHQGDRRQDRGHYAKLLGRTRTRPS